MVLGLPRRFLVVLAAAALGGGCADGNCRRANRGWCPAEYHGLRVGDSTRDDLLRVLGRPDSVQAEKGREYAYFTDREYDGPAMVELDPDGAVRTVVVYPRALPRDSALARLGHGHTVTRYDVERCFGGDEPYFFESPTGKAVMIEYRPRGIALQVSRLGMVDMLVFVSEPWGAARTRCPG